MGHSISGLITRHEALTQLEGRLAEQPKFTLLSGLGFLPLDHKNLDSIVGLNAGEPLRPFQYLTTPLMDLLRVRSQGRTLVYVETDYFGGVGGQGAAVFREGRVRFGPHFTKGKGGAINEAFAWLDVTTASGCLDAFETVGLSRCRCNDDFSVGGVSA